MKRSLISKLTKLVDFSSIEDLFSTFTKINDISLFLYDSNEKLIVESKNDSTLYHLFQDKQKAWEEIIHELRQNLVPYDQLHTYYKYLEFFSIPINIGNHCVAFIIGGPFLSKIIDKSQKTELAAELEMNQTIQNKYLSSYQPFSTEKISDTIKLCSSLAKVIEQWFFDKYNSNLNTEKLSTLYEVSKTVNSSLNLQEVLQIVLNTTLNLLEARAGSLMLINKEQKELRILVARGLDEEIIKTVKIKLGDGIAGSVAQSGKPLLLLKGQKDPRSKKDSTVKDEEIKSALCVPLQLKGKVIGVINVSDRIGGDNFSEDNLELLRTLADQVSIAIENAELYEDLQDLFLSSIKALANAVDARDPYTLGHSERVTQYAVEIAKLMGLGQKDLETLQYASLLHDIGKLNINDSILNKPGALTAEEFEIIKKHPEVGARIMEPVKQFKDVLPILYHHHECYGRHGYPQGLQGEEIPLAARILAVADSFDAMTSDRPYRRALPPKNAIDELKRCCGIQFDPRVVEAFEKAYEEGKF